MSFKNFIEGEKQIDAWLDKKPIIGFVNRWVNNHAWPIMAFVALLGVIAGLSGLWIGALILAVLLIVGCCYLRAKERYYDQK